jgi:hypothetical protein
MCANQIFGLAPCKSWESKELNVPKVTHQCALQLLDVFDWGSKRLDKGNEWKMYFDRGSGWFCVGNPDFSGMVNVNFIQNAIVALDETGEIKALWIKSVLKDDLPSQISLL